MTNQEQIDKLATKAEKILKEVETLKGQPGAENLDFSRLDAALTATDDINADATEPNPAPADPTTGEDGTVTEGNEPPSAA